MKRKRKHLLTRETPDFPLVEDSPSILKKSPVENLGSNIIPKDLRENIDSSPNAIQNKNSYKHREIGQKIVHSPSLNSNLNTFISNKQKELQSNLGLEPLSYETTINFVNKKENTNLAQKFFQNIKSNIDINQDSINNLPNLGFSKETVRLNKIGKVNLESKLDKKTSEGFSFLNSKNSPDKNCILNIFDNNSILNNNNQKLFNSTKSNFIQTKSIWNLDSIYNSDWGELKSNIKKNTNLKEKKIDQKIISKSKELNSSSIKNQSIFDESEFDSFSGPSFDINLCNIKEKSIESQNLPIHSKKSILPYSNTISITFRGRTYQFNPMDSHIGYSHTKIPKIQRFNGKNKKKKIIDNHLTLIVIPKSKDVVAFLHPEKPTNISNRKKNRVAECRICRVPLFHSNFVYRNAIEEHINSQLHIQNINKMKDYATSVEKYRKIIKEKLHCKKERKVSHSRKPSWTSE